MAKQLPPAPPTEALPGGESNPYLAKFKASLVIRWSVSKSAVLYEMAELVAFLWALERPREAAAVAAAVTAAVPVPPPLPRDRVNYSLWCPATYSHALLVRLGAATHSAGVAASRAALLADAGIARDNPAFLARQVADARETVAAPSEPRAMKLECQRIARDVGQMTLYAELGAAGDPLFTDIGPEANGLLTQLLPKLAARLRPKSQSPAHE
jgi:hypothetical protein